MAFLTIEARGGTRGPARVTATTKTLPSRVTARVRATVPDDLFFQTTPGTDDNEGRDVYPP